MTSNGSAVPVGLLGEQRKTIDGSCRRACSAADSAVRSKVPGSPVPRSPSTQVVPSVSLMIGCIE